MIRTRLASASAGKIATARAAASPAPTGHAGHPDALTTPARLLILLGLLFAALLAGCKAPATAEQLAAEQERARKRAALLTLARDTRLDLVSRREAVRQLIASGQPEARDQLITELYSSNDPTAQQAIAQALAAVDPAPPQAFQAPLLALLERADPNVPNLQADTAAALGRFDDNKLVDRLLQVAQDRKENENFRRGAILALGYSRSQDVAKVLTELMQPPNSTMLRQAAFDALEVLSGIDSYGADPEVWLDWWRVHRRMSREEFLKRLLDNFARYNQRNDARDLQVQSRLVDLQRQVYRNASAEERPAVLVQMLSDDLGATRQLAMDLMLQRLIDNEPTPATLRAALLQRLDDPLNSMRQRAASLLREMRDEQAADAVARRLAEGREKSVAVRKAYLLMVARLPREGAVEPALLMLADEDLRAEAAAALAAAADAGMLTPDQAARAAATVRQQVRSDTLPPEQLVSLLGRVGNDSDFALIRGYLDVNDAAVKQAAAKAWASSGRSLSVLAQRASDPIIRDIVIEAAIAGGDDRSTFFALIDNKPPQDQVALAWRRALVEMARRVEPRAVVDGDVRLQQIAEPLTTRDAILSAALERFEPKAQDDPAATTNPAPAPAPAATPVPVVSSNNDLVELLLARAAVRLPSDPALRHPLSPLQQERLERGLIQARLGTGQVAGAFELARRVLGNSGAPRLDTAAADQVVGWFLDHAQKSAAAGRPELARSVLSQVRALFGGLTSPTVSRRHNQLEAELPDSPAAAPNANSGS